jgi:hypothetical protein
MLSICGLNGSGRAKMMRHTHDMDERGVLRCSIDELVRQGWLDTSQCYQKKRWFDDADVIVSFYALQRTQAWLYGVFSVGDRRAASQGTAPVNCPLAPTWREECHYFYDLQRPPGFEALERRLVIDWGRPRPFARRLADTPVLELLPEGRRLPPFEDYLEFSLLYNDLTDLYRHEDAHHDWRAALQAVASVYLILAQDTGDLYVGSAYGQDGVWGRWRDYAATGHGNNVSLIELIERNPGVYPQRFRFSLLQVLPKTLARDEVLARERLYMGKLGSRAIGLNN